MNIILQAVSSSRQNMENLIPDGCLGRKSPESGYCLDFIRDMFQKLEPSESEK